MPTLKPLRENIVFGLGHGFKPFGISVNNNPDNELMAFIGALADSNPSVRAEAAAEIFGRGRDLARAAVAKWLTDNTLLNCFVLDASRFPEATVGLAVEPAHFELIWRACGCAPLADVPPDQDAREFELEFPNGARLDILTTGASETHGAMARHLQRFGESIQQIELLATSVDEATRLLRSRLGLVPVFPETRAGANGSRVNFFLVPTSENKKVLIEIVEPPSRARTLC